MIFLVTNILWDTDGDDDVILPRRVVISVENEEDISDELTNQTGFCHFGFQYAPYQPGD